MAMRAIGNPMLDLFERWSVGATNDGPGEWVARYGFAVPDDRALGVIAAASPNGVVEVGAGTGYWSRMLGDRGVDVVAFDLEPPPSAANRWFAGREPWFPVRPGDAASVAATHADRTLLLVWPTRNEDWGADAALAHLAHGGRRLVYVGEPPGGRSGDARLHAALGLIDRCVACAYGATNAPCTCDVKDRWRVRDAVALPRWHDRDDALYLCTPSHAGPGPWWRRAGWRDR